MELLNEVKKRDNCQIISGKMARTVSICRQEVVNQAPSVSDLEDYDLLFFNEAHVNIFHKKVCRMCNVEVIFYINKLSCFD